MNSPVRFSPVNRRNLENTNTIVRTDWNETKRCVILSLSPSFLFFPPFLSFFLFHSHSNSPKLPTENRKIEPEPSPFSTRVEQLALPPPSPRSVAVRTIIAAWIIAESNNKRPWSPPLPTGLLRDLTFVQRNGRDYELFTPPSLPPSLLSKLGARFENGRGGDVHDPSPSKFVEIFHSLMGKKKLWKNFV